MKIVKVEIQSNADKEVSLDKAEKQLLQMQQSIGRKMARTTSTAKALELSGASAILAGAFQSKNKGKISKAVSIAKSIMNNP